MQDNPYSINSRLWWEDYFVEDWDSHGGTDQTRYFMQRLLAELPLPEAAFMRSRLQTAESAVACLNIPGG
ncbi:MAG TPA: hypothetical protein VJH03_23760 [Blastocatellia bacterium]|nr:hypothetical protein [Blastocatellia bacterium]